MGQFLWMRRLVLLLAIVGFGLPAPARAVGSGVIASANVELLTTIPDVGAVGGKIREVDGRRYLLTTGAGGVSAYDVTQPDQPSLAGHLALPHLENEDVEMSDDIMLVAVDPAFMGSALSGLYVLDISNLPLITFAYVNTETGNRFRTGSNNSDGYIGGHTISCIRPDCTWAYATGGGGSGRSLYVIDLRNPADPHLAGVLPSPVGGAHDATIQSDGLAWVVGIGGVAALDVTDPLQPRMLLQHNPSELDYVHNVTRRGDTLLITEENWVAPQCYGQGRFSTGRIRDGDVEILDTWTPALGGEKFAGVYMDGDSPSTLTCSAHWFDDRDDTVAIAWYEQGLRFLDVSDPAHIAEAGWFIPPGGEAFAAVWASDDIVYSLDTTRGIDVVRFDASVDPGLRAAPPVAVSVGTNLRPHPYFGYACAIAAV